MTEHDQQTDQTPQGTISRRVVREPVSGNPGRAGLAVAYDFGARPGEKFRIEQLWPPGPEEEAGRAEPVYVDDGEVIDLVQTILAHYEWEVVERDPRDDGGIPRGESP